LKRPSRERERPSSEAPDDGLEPRAVVRPAPRPAPHQPPQSWARRYWVSIVGVSVGLLVSIWRFGIPQLPRHPGSGQFAWRGGPVATAEFHWHGPITAGHQVQVKGLNGAIHADAAGGNEVEVTAIKRSRGNSPTDVPIAVIQSGGDVTFCAAVPGDVNNCAEGGEGGPGGVSVEYTVHVPKGVLFTAHSVNGGITVEDLSAAVELETVNGGIQVSTSGSAKAETVNGSIRAAVGSTSQDLSFHTVNGSISVAVPENASVDVRAETMSGSITSDFPLNIPKTQPGEQKTASGRIGSGGHELSLETVNGSISLQKGSRGGGTPPTPPTLPRPPRPGRPTRER
jgi:hypothetical protein